MQPLHPDTSYHIFNHANGFENIFRHEANYYFFLEKYRKYIGPIAETYAWCLMPNHFHLVIRIRKRPVLVDNFSYSKRFSKVITADQRTFKISKDFLQPGGKNFGKSISRNANFGKVISDSEIEKYLSKQFANLFSCYTQSFNKVYDRMGSLFVKNFKRETISDKNQFLNTIAYVHRNPVHHGFCKQYDEWPYSSYLAIINGNNDGVETDKLLKITGGLEGLVEIHRRSLERIDTSNYPDIPLSYD
jgi:REP element-mobilizing transposase RayT